MSIKVIVFDFDGTLIDSNSLKRDAYYKLFEQKQEVKKIIGNVLKKYYEKSRYVILEEILRELKLTQRDEKFMQKRIDQMASQYNRIVLLGAKECAEMDGANRILKQLKERYRLYISSFTPKEALDQIINYRCWSTFFDGVFGYPTTKLEALTIIMKKEDIEPSEICVVGDGATDRSAAQTKGCYFFGIDQKHALKDFLKSSILKESEE